MNIKKVVIIGSGTMGSGIAAHLCNAKIPVTLLDLTTDISTQARDRIYKSRPPLLIDKNKCPTVKSEEGQSFINWLTSYKGQKTIGLFNIDGQKVFIPTSK